MQLQDKSTNCPASMDQRETNSAGTWPNFIGIGVQRSATTWVYACLREHPEVFVSNKKEIHFFDEFFEQGTKWYCSHFCPRPGQVAIGEITPNYFDSESTLIRIAETLPNAKLFVILRNPVERTFSAYRLLSDRFKGMTFMQACERGNDIVQASHYAEKMDFLYQCFPRHQVKVFLYEDVQLYPARVLAELFAFVGVNDSFVPPSIGKVYNHILFPNAQGVLRKVKLGWLVNAVKQTSIGVWIKKYVSLKNNAAMCTAHDAYCRKLKEEFRDDILRLQEIIGRDLTMWL